MSDDTQSLDNDFKIHDAYVAFSAEVARLALLGPVVLSFLVLFAGENPDRAKLVEFLKPGLLWIAWSLLTLGISVSLALGHRYFANDFMAEHIDLLRKNRKDSGWKMFTSKTATFCIVVAPVCLAVGWALMLMALYKVLSVS